jgi:hypothetical protein
LRSMASFESRCLETHLSTPSGLITAPTLRCSAYMVGKSCWQLGWLFLLFIMLALLAREQSTLHFFHIHELSVETQVLKHRAFTPISNRRTSHPPTVSPAARRPISMNDTTNRVAWEAESTHRGSLSIFSAALSTLFICAWTTLHLSLPRRGEGRRQVMRHVLAMVGALLAPEFTLVVALHQLCEARHLAEQMRESLHQPAQMPRVRTWINRIWNYLCARAPRSDTATEILELQVTRESDTAATHACPHYPIILSHGFLALMGGFVFELNEDDIGMFPRGARRLTLTGAGIRFLTKVEPQFIPDLSEEDIQDRSLSSPFAKTALCIQVVWYCITVIIRWKESLLVTLLELTTIIHATFAFATNTLWWYKPRGMQTPFVIQNRLAEPLAAFMAVSSYHELGQRCEKKPQLSLMLDDQESQSAHLQNSDGTVSLLPGQCLHGFKFSGWVRNGVDFNEPLMLTRDEVEAFSRAEYAVHKWNLRNMPAEERSGDLLVERVSDNPIESTSLKTIKGLILLGIAGAAYSCLHLVAWAHPFRFNSLAWAWRISCLYTVAMYLPICLIAWLISRFRGVVVIPILISFIIHAYVASRLFLLAAAIDEGFHLLPGAFITPQLGKQPPRYC